MTEPPLKAVAPGRFRVKTVDGYHIEIIQMITNVRIVETPVEDERFYQRYWCYSTLMAAAAAAWVWDGGAETEPMAYRKRGGARWDTWTR